MSLVVSALSLVVVGTAQAASGFLEDYPTMSPDPQHAGGEIFVTPDSSLKGYGKVAIDPVLVWYADDSKYKGIDPNELAAITNGLHEILVATLEPKYAVVGSAGEGVLQLRLAITNVKAEKKKRRLLGYTPIGLVTGAVKNLASAGPNIILNEATIEAELLDEQGARLAVIIAPLVSGESKKEALTWDKIGAELTAYGQRLQARLDADNAE